MRRRFAPHQLRAAGQPPPFADRDCGEPRHAALVERDVLAAQERGPRALAGVLDRLLGRVGLGRNKALQPRGIASVEVGDLLRPGGGRHHGGGSPSAGGWPEALRAVESRACWSPPPEGESEICRARAATQGQPVRAGRRPPRSGALEVASTSGTLNRLPWKGTAKPGGLRALTRRQLRARGVRRRLRARGLRRGRGRRCGRAAPHRSRDPLPAPVRDQAGAVAGGRGHVSAGDPPRCAAGIRWPPPAQDFGLIARDRLRRPARGRATAWPARSGRPPGAWRFQRRAGSRGSRRCARETAAD